MARRLETTVASAVKSAVGMLASGLGITLGVVVLLPEGPLGEAAKGPIRVALEGEGLKVGEVFAAVEGITDETREMLLVTQ